jgi:hypothetical protein
MDFSRITSLHTLNPKISQDHSAHWVNIFFYSNNPFRLFFTAAVPKEKTDLWARLSLREPAGPTTRLALRRS